MGDTRPVFFFDIDNCVRALNQELTRLLLTMPSASSIQEVRTSQSRPALRGRSVGLPANLRYRAESNIHDEMQKLIHKFFVHHLSLNAEDAHMLHMKYYKEYGLAIEGLTRHHKIDPLEFNRLVDDALPLDDILKPDPKLRQLLEDIDRDKVKLWLLTNAYVNHGKRVVKLLHVDDLFEGITYCDYANPPLVCKPSQLMYDKAERDAGVMDKSQCYFVDDSGLNCKAAAARGWHVAHLVEPGLPSPEVPVSQFQIRSLEELRTCFPQLFKKT